MCISPSKPPVCGYGRFAYLWHLHPIRFMRITKPLLFPFILSLACYIAISGFTGNKKRAKLISAESQRSVSGIKGGANSTEYYFKVKILTSEKIEFDSLWIGKNVFSPFIKKSQTSVSSESPTFSKNDTITLRVSDFQSGKSNSVSTPPISYQGSALIRYVSKGKSNYLVVKEIKSIQGVNKP